MYVTLIHLILLVLIFCGLSFLISNFGENKYHYRNFFHVHFRKCFAVEQLSSVKFLYRSAIISLILVTVMSSNITIWILIKLHIIFVNMISQTTVSVVYLRKNFLCLNLEKHNLIGVVNYSDYGFISLQYYSQIRNFTTGPRVANSI